MSSKTSNSPAASAPKEERGRSKSGFLGCLVLLAVVLLVLFHRSFEQDRVLFSNDGPLGAVVSTADTAYQAFTGNWRALNWIGHEDPSALPNMTQGVFLVLGPALFGNVGGPVMFAKFYVPVCLLIVGICAWFFFRQQGFNNLVALLGALAAALNTDPFSYACWGLASVALCLASVMAALGIATRSPRGTFWVRLVLAGFCVGMAIMEGYDVGAILSLYVAAFVLFQAWIEKGAPADRLAKGSGRVVLVAMCAALISAHALSTLIGTQIKGIVGTKQDESTKEKRWDEATMWSLPKIETLRVIIPGLFGYRMDTADGGNYWGAVGQTPGFRQTRHSGSGVYAGVLVVLIAIWALARSARGGNSPFSERERKLIWFWAGTALVSLLLAYGRHAAFYQFLYKLPYFSTIRNPIKFMHPFTIAVVILFGYGLEGLWRAYLQKGIARADSLGAHLKNWWRTVKGFERRWAVGSVIAVATCLLGFVLYISSRRELERYLTSISSEQFGFPPTLVPAVATFSIHEAGWFVLFLGLGVGAVAVIMSGWLSGARARWGIVLLGLLLLADLFRANFPWIVYYNYKEKYASNPIIDQLRQNSFEHRVAARLAPMSGNYLATGQAQGLFRTVAEEWLQQLFQFYQVQSLDIVQMPRVPEVDSAYMAGIFNPGFSSLDFTNVAVFVGKLTNHTDTVSQFLWSKLGPAAQKELEQSGGATSAVPVLRSELTRITRTNAIYEPTRFAGIKLSEGARALLGQQDLPERELARLNRLLLEDAFPAELDKASQLAPFGRLWQLTNTRYILGMTAYLELINQQLDPVNHSYKVRTAFDFAPRAPASAQGFTSVEDITTVIRPEGQFAVFEYGGALPRAKLFAQWQTVTNDSTVLQLLADRAFDPQRRVLVANPLAAPTATASDTAGTVAITLYQPKRVSLKANAASACVLLLNDRYDSNWKVTVDGKPAPLLQCNYIMRGVSLEPGNHEVEFRFDPPHWTLYVSLAAIAVGLGLCGVLAMNPGPTEATASELRAVPASVVTASKARG